MEKNEEKKESLREQIKIFRWVIYPIDLLDVNFSSGMTP